MSHTTRWASDIIFITSLAHFYNMTQRCIMTHFCNMTRFRDIKLFFYHTKKMSHTTRWASDIIFITSLAHFFFWTLFCNVTHLCVRNHVFMCLNQSFTCVAWLICACDMTRLHVCALKLENNSVPGGKKTSSSPLKLANSIWLVYMYVHSN